MGYSSLYGTGAAMLFVLGVAGYGAMDRTTNYAPAKASVSMIDRKCDLIETTTDSDGTKTSRGYNDDCNSIDEWETVREKRNKKVSGKAVVHISYIAPQDGTSHSSKLEFDGRDDEFYQLKAGDEIDILVSKTDPDKVMKG